MAKLYFAILKEIDPSTSPQVAKLSNGQYATQDEEQFFNGLLSKVNAHLAKKVKPRLRSLSYTREDIDLAIRQAITEQIREVKNLSVQIQ